MDKHSWEKATVDFSAGELFGNNGDLLKIDRNQFALNPKTGRFYPKGRLRGLTGGEGYYSVEISHYDVVPGNIAQQISAAAQKGKKNSE